MHTLPNGWVTHSQLVHRGPLSGPRSLSIARMSTDDREYQRYIVQAINAERAAQGLTAKALRLAAGLPDKTFRRAMSLERDLNIEQLDRIARALDVDPSVLARDADQRRLRAAGAGSVTTGVPEQDALLRAITAADTASGDLSG